MTDGVCGFVVIGSRVMNIYLLDKRDVVMSPARLSLWVETLHLCAGKCATYIHLTAHSDNIMIVYSYSGCTQRFAQGMISLCKL